MSAELQALTSLSLSRFLRVAFLPEDIDAAVPVCEEEHVVVVVPGNLVHLELELLLRPGAVRLCVDEGHHVVFVAHGDGLTIRAPADVDVLTFWNRKKNTLKTLFLELKSGSVTFSTF